MTTFRASVSLVSAIALVGLPVAAQAETAREMRYIVGKNTGSANRDLDRAGFELKDSDEAGSVRRTHWWDDKDDECILVQSMNNRIISVTDATKKDCKESGPSKGAVVGALAGAALIAALLASKKKDKDHTDKYTTQDERDLYDSGYYDGAQGNPYHNPRNSSAYSDGYSEGSKHHQNQGSKVEISDLNNARAAGGMEELERRGFSQVDNFTSGNTRYSIQWREASSQCVQVTIADGRFADVRDIGTHPKCGSAYSAPAEISDLNNARAAGGMDELERRGFTQVDNFTSGNTRYSIQWRSSSNQCVQVTIADGRFADVRDIGTHPKCR